MYHNIEEGEMDAFKLGDVVQAMTIGEVVGLTKDVYGYLRVELKIVRADKSVTFAILDLDDVAPMPEPEDLEPAT